MNYLEDIYRLKHVKRYSNIPKITEESVAEHGFFVAAIVIKLHEEYKFDLGQALVIAISHDMTEMELNDCPWVIKQKYPEIAAAYAKCEEDVSKTLPTMVAWGARAFDAEDKTVEAKIVHLADAMQCLQYSGIEIKLGSDGYMQNVHVNAERRILDAQKELKEYER